MSVDRSRCERRQKHIDTTTQTITTFQADSFLFERRITMKKLLVFVLVILMLVITVGPVSAAPPFPPAPWSNAHAGWTPPAPWAPGPK